MKYFRTKLSNGSSLVLLQIPYSASVTIAAYIKAGFRLDPPAKPGLAHFVEHMLFAGTKKYPSHHDLAYAIERLGGWHNAFTWIDYQYHEVCVPRGKFKQGIDILLETLFSSLFQKGEVEKEKGLIKEEILRNKSNLEKAIWDYAWLPLFFQSTKLARPYSGTESDVENINRIDIVDFLKTNFLPENIVFLIGGNITLSEARDVLESYLKNPQVLRKITYDTNLTAQTDSHIYILRRDVDQTALAVGVKTVNRNHPDRHALAIIRNMLFRDFGASLPERLRNEGGLIYTWSSYQESFLETGYLLFKTLTNNKNVLRVMETILEEFARIASGKITNEEIEVAKSHSIGSLQVYVETGFDYVHWYGLQELLTPKTVLHLQDQVKIYQKVTKEDVINGTRKYFSRDNIYIAAIGKLKKRDVEKLLT